jgi:hypothetical protein
MFQKKDIKICTLYPEPGGIVFAWERDAIPSEDLNMTKYESVVSLYPGHRKIQRNFSKIRVFLALSYAIYLLGGCSVRSSDLGNEQVTSVTISNLPPSHQLELIAIEQTEKSGKTSKGIRKEFKISHQNKETNLVFPRGSTWNFEGTLKDPSGVAVASNDSEFKNKTDLKNCPSKSTKMDKPTITVNLELCSLKKDPNVHQTPSPGVDPGKQTQMAMPTRLAIKSKSGENLQFEVQFTNKNSFSKICDAVVQVRTKTNRTKQWIKAWTMESDQSIKFHVSFPDVLTEPLEPSSVQVGAKCVANAQANDKKGVSSPDKCDPAQKSCERLCVAIDQTGTVCQKVRQDLSIKKIDISNHTDHFKLNYEIHSHSNVTCGFSLVTSAQKEGTSTTTSVKKSISNRRISEGTQLLEIELAKNSAGDGYILDPKSAILYASCLDISNVPFWDIISLTNPERYSQENWLKL